MVYNKENKGKVFMSEISKKNLPLVSIIVPVYNTERFLATCIESIIAQTYDNFELLLIDDGSKDGSLSLCQSYEKRDNRIKVFSFPNGGPSVTRNRGLDIVSGEYVCFIDSDDYVSKWFIEDLYSGILKGADVSVILDTRVSEKQRNIFKKAKRSRNLAHIEYDKTHAMRVLFSGKKFGLGPCNKMFKSEIFKGENKIRFNEEIFYSEDVPFLYDVFIRAERVVLYPKVNYAYTRRNGSQVRSKITDKKTTAINAVKYCTDKCAVELSDAHSYVSGWRLLLNFEMFFYMWRDGYYKYSLYLHIREVFKTRMKDLTSSKGFPLYRRVLLPFASWLLNLFFRVKFRKQLKIDEKKAATK